MEPSGTGDMDLPNLWVFLPIGSKARLEQWIRCTCMQYKYLLHSCSARPSDWKSVLEINQVLIPKGCILRQPLKEFEALNTCHFWIFSAFVVINNVFHLNNGNIWVFHWNISNNSFFSAIFLTPETTSSDWSLRISL